MDSGSNWGSGKEMCSRSFKRVAETLKRRVAVVRQYRQDCLLEIKNRRAEKKERGHHGVRLFLGSRNRETGYIRCKSVGIYCNDI